MQIYIFIYVLVGVSLHCCITARLSRWIHDNAVALMGLCIQAVKIALNHD